MPNSPRKLLTDILGREDYYDKYDRSFGAKNYRRQRIVAYLFFPFGMFATFTLIRASGPHSNILDYYLLDAAIAPIGGIVGYIIGSIACAWLFFLTNHVFRA